MGWASPRALKDDWKCEKSLKFCFLSYSLHGKFYGQIHLNKMFSQDVIRGEGVWWGWRLKFGRREKDQVYKTWAKKKKKKQAISNTDSALNNREGATTAPSPDWLNKQHLKQIIEANILNSCLYQWKMGETQSSKKYCKIKIGIGQIEQSVGMKLHLVWQYLMRWKWAERKIPNVEGERFKYFTILQETFIEYILSIFVRGVGKKSILL